MAIASFTENNEDIFFLMYNSFNEFLMAIRRSSQLYILEMVERTDQREEISMILFVLAVLTLVATFVILLPVIASVN